MTARARAQRTTGMANPDVLFRGIPRGPTRAYTSEAIAAARPDLIVIPCTGPFSLASVAAGAGMTPAAIACGDISIYSTALGHAIMGEDWRVSTRPEHPLAPLVE